MSQHLRLAVYLQLHTGFGLGILRGLARYVREQPGIDLIKFPKPTRYDVSAMRALHLDGVIAKISSAEDAAALARLGIPVVNVSGRVATPRMHVLNTDDLRVGEMACGHFTRRGYRAVAYCGPPHHRASRLRQQGLETSAQAAGCAFHHYALRRSDEASAYPAPTRRALAAWLKSLPHPVGVLAFTDYVAIELAEAAGLAGLRVPDQVAILGVGNDLTRLDFAHTEVSSIELPTQQIGYRAAELLLAMIRGERPPPTETLFNPPKIATRRSTDHFAVADEAVALALDYMREHQGNAIYVDDIAHAAALSRRALEKRFSRAMGTTIYGMVQRLQQERAQELLADQNLNLEEVACASGYTDARHLCMAFRRRLGQPPSTYRRGLKSKPGEPATSR